MIGTIKERLWPLVMGYVLYAAASTFLLLLTSDGMTIVYLLIRCGLLYGMGFLVLCALALGQHVRGRTHVEIPVELLLVIAALQIGLMLFNFGSCSLPGAGAFVGYGYQFIESAYLPEGFRCAPRDVRPLAIFFYVFAWSYAISLAGGLFTVMATARQKQRPHRHLEHPRTVLAIVLLLAAAFWVPSAFVVFGRLNTDRLQQEQWSMEATIREQFNSSITPQFCTTYEGILREQGTFDRQVRLRFACWKHVAYNLRDPSYCQDLHTVEFTMVKECLIRIPGKDEVI